MQIMTNSEQIEAEFCIRSLLVRERYYRDTCQWERLRDCYHSDPQRTAINISWYKGDIDGFVCGSQVMAQKGSNALHSITPVEVNINGQKAFAVSTGNITTRFEIAGVEYELLSNCRFLSRLCRLDSAPLQDWKMCSLEAIYINDLVYPVFPSQVTFDAPSGDSRKSYRHLAWLLERKGFDVDWELPGIDRPDTVTNILEENMAWLC